MTNFGDSARQSVPQKNAAWARVGGGQLPPTGLPHAAEHQMVVEVGPPGQVLDDVDSEWFEVPGGPDAGLHEDLGRLHSSEAEYDLARGTKADKAPL